MLICVAGKNDIAVECTEFLLTEQIASEKNLVTCSNDTDKGVDSFQRSFKKYCRERNLSEATLDYLSSAEDLLFISLEYDKIIPAHRFTSKALFNVHFSLLPKYKGFYTSAWPILNGEPTSGVTLHEIDQGIDTGDIIDQIEFEISQEDNCRDLYMKYIHYGILVFKKNILNLLSGTYAAREQAADGSSYYSRDSINYADLRIDLRKTAEQIRNQIRAYNFKEYQIPKVFGFEITRADIVSGKRSKEKPGTILKQDDGYIDIATIDYDLRLHKANNTQ